jgi:hypothetical protein
VDKKALIEIPGHRTVTQCAEIASIDSMAWTANPICQFLPPRRVSWSWKSAMMMWTTDPAACDTKLAHKAMKKCERNMWVLIEVACASTLHHLVAVRKAYHETYSASLEEDVAAQPPHARSTRTPSSSRRGRLLLPSCAVRC